MLAPSNPEFEYYRQQILQRRRYYPFYGLLLFITGSLGFLALFSAYLDNPAAITRVNQDWFIHLLLLLGFLASTISGIFLIARTYIAPSQAQIQRFRRTERQRLFLQAHGHLRPWWSCLIVRILLILFGLLFASGGLTAIFLFGLRAWDGWIYLLISGILISLVFYFIPRELRKLPALSAEQLAQNWIAGEATTGEDTPNT